MRVWALFPQDTKYFGSGNPPLIRVENLEELLAALRAEGVPVEPKIETYDCGKFGWIRHPEGNRIEAVGASEDALMGTARCRAISSLPSYYQR